MPPTVLVTGAAGNIGRKLRRHFASLGWTVRALDVSDGGDRDVAVCDLSVWDEGWVRAFEAVDAVIHLAGDPSPQASWASVQRLNLDLTLNVYEAAARQGAKRLIFASSNWTVGGHRFGSGPLETDQEPYPVNAYGASKLVGERLGKSYSDRWGLSVVCFRIGYCQRDHDNRPGRHMGWGSWGQLMWLSDRDLCQAYAKAVLAPPDLRFAVLNLMSDNEGMRWDLEATRRAIGYVPEDHASPVVTDEVREEEAAAGHARRLVEAAEAFLGDRRW